MPKIKMIYKDEEEEVFSLLEQFPHSHVFVKSFEFEDLIFSILDLIKLQLGTPCFPKAKFSIW